MSQDHDSAYARKGLITGVVIAASGIAAMLAPWIVQLAGLGVRHEVLIYLFSLAGFVWALVNIYQLWRMRQNSQR